MVATSVSQSKAPNYFWDVQKKAAELWDLLEKRPDLAGPWHQLFSQVQSPRHIISELLQNADDAGATEASIDIQNGEFIFTHNGEDFTEEHFSSLCNFGYSNKRSLHTIGFRGIGFKSTFSLGNQVCLSTPTLSVIFNKEQFTLPLWNNSDGLQTCTEIRVSIQDLHRQKELEKNLAEWINSPVSLLFFHNLRGLRVSEREVCWQSQGVGPLPDSHWMALESNPEKKYLLIQSSEEEFPVEALDEIRQERMVLNPEEVTFPPCRVEIVLGMEGRLFVVLPTGVSTKLPFACNAPFMQDPARVKIKDPDISVTNRWLLARAGVLAAKAMLAWLENDALPIEERVKAYELLPNVDRDSSSLNDSCATIVEQAFETALHDAKFVITESKQLVAREEALSVPNILLQTWPYKKVSSLFATPDTPILSRHIAGEYVSKLINWRIVKPLTDSMVVDALKDVNLPRPATWRKLMTFWAYLYRVGLSQWPHCELTDAKIVPVRGHDVLYSSEEVVRLAEKKLLNSDEDWMFLGQWLLVLDQNWPRFLVKQKNKAKNCGTDVLGQEATDAYKLLSDLNLTESSDVNEIIDNVSSSFFGQDSIKLEDCVRLTQIAAKLDASTPDSFEFVTCDLRLRSIDYCVLVDAFNDIDAFVNEEWFNSHVLHSDYSVMQSCTAEEWRQWLFSKRSKLNTFIPVEQKDRTLWGRLSLQEELRKRGLNRELGGMPYKTNDFIIKDWDFAKHHWQFWAERANEDKDFWGVLLARIVKQFAEVGPKINPARVFQVATTGNKKPIVFEPLSPSWILRFKELKCLQDNYGSYCYPSELLRRTPETEVLLDVEPFINAELDTEETRPLLDLLGVRNTATGTARLLERIRSLSMADKTPVYIVEKWYHRLDKLVERCSTDELMELKAAFANEKLIFTENGAWGSSHEVFLVADETSIPQAALVHSAVRDLALWIKVGVPNYPTAELGIQWLRTLNSGKGLHPDESRRVKALLQRYPQRIWDECGHWINLETEWVPVDNLEYSLTMQTLVPWKHLFTPVKQKTADLQMLANDICEQFPFIGLMTLSSIVEERIDDEFVLLKKATKIQWMETLGSVLSRVILDDEEETARIQKIARRLAHTSCQKVSNLKAIPYIDGAPAGESKRITVRWLTTSLYLDGVSTAKMAKEIVQEIGRVFIRPDIIEAIKFCYERKTEFIVEYLSNSFRLQQEANSTAIQVVEEVDNNSLLKPTVVIPTNAILGTEVGDAIGHELWRKENAEFDIADNSTNKLGSEEKLRELDEENANVSNAKQNKSRLMSLKPNLFELYALNIGYVKDSNADKFLRKDGGWIQYASGNIFPWQELSPTGELLQCYWTKDVCIEKEPLQIEAEVWELCKNRPEKHSLILKTSNDKPIRFSGTDVRNLLEDKKIKLFPATYRLVLVNEKRLIS